MFGFFSKLAAYGAIATDPGETIEFELLGFRCDREGLEPLEPKNCSKTGIFDDFRHFLMSFWIPVALNLDGRI